MKKLKSSIDSRRKFLKTAAVASLSLTSVPLSVQAAKPNQTENVYKKQVDREVAKSKQQSYMDAQQELSVQSFDPRFQLDLGTNDTIYDPNYGDAGKYSSGWTPKAWGSSYDASLDRAEAAVVTGPAGAGSGTAWAWIGREIYINGTGSQTANIIGRGSIVGLLTAAGAASCEGRVTLVVTDYTTGGTRYDDVIFSKGDGGYEDTDVNTTFNNGMSMVLEAGHDYMVSMEVDAEVTLSAAGEGGSDFGGGDGDGVGTQGVSFTSIEFRF